MRSKTFLTVRAAHREARKRNNEKVHDHCVECGVDDGRTGARPDVRNFGKFQLLAIEHDHARLITNPERDDAVCDARFDRQRKLRLGKHESELHGRCGEFPVQRGCLQSARRDSEQSVDKQQFADYQHAAREQQSSSG